MQFLKKEKSIFYEIQKKYFFICYIYMTGELEKFQDGKKIKI